MQSLFPQRAPAQAASNVLVSFPAGKCQLIPQTGGKFMITPEPRRGTVSLEKDTDGLTHFVWTDRTTGVREDDQIVFPNEVTFKKAKGGKPDDRVYFLHFDNSNRYNFFWMQEKSADKDTEYCNKINEYANNPAAADAALAAASASAGARAGAGAGGMGQDAWMQMMGLGGMPGMNPPGAPATGGASAAATANNPFAQLDLSSLLSQYGATAGGAGGSAAGGPPGASGAGGDAPEEEGEGEEEGGEEGDEGEGGEEGEELNAMEALLSVGALEDPVVTAQLLQHLPDGMRTEEILVETVNGAAFQELYEAVRGSLPEEQVASGVADMSLHSPRLEVMRQRRVQELIMTLNLLFPSDGGSME